MNYFNLIFSNNSILRIFQKEIFKGFKINGDIIETQKLLKWKPSVKFNTIIYKMINNELF